MNQRPDVRLLLDEMFSPAIAAELRERGHAGCGSLRETPERFRANSVTT